MTGENDDYGEGDTPKEPEPMSLEQLNGAVLVYETKDGEEVRVEFDE